jgi:phytoene dehydrogenase-like protein
VLESPIVVGAREVTNLHVRTFREDPTLAPEGSSVVQVVLETDYDLWQDLHHAPRRYAERKVELAAAVARRLDRHLPGLASAIDMTDVATPYTYWRFARSWRGAYEGWLPTWQSLLHKPERTLPGLAGFHMCGQWVEPGGGVPTALLSGRQVIEDLARETRRPSPAAELHLL